MIAQREVVYRLYFARAARRGLGAAENGRRRWPRGRQCKPFGLMRQTGSYPCEFYFRYAILSRYTSRIGVFTAIFFVTQRILLAFVF